MGHGCDKRFEAVRAESSVHLDFVHRNLHRASTFTLIVIDDCARFVTGLPFLLVGD